MSHTNARVVDVQVNGDSITVTVAIDQPISILKFLGNSREVRATATARNVRGIVSAET